MPNARLNEERALSKEVSILFKWKLENIRKMDAAKRDEAIEAYLRFYSEGYSGGVSFP